MAIRREILLIAALLILIAILINLVGFFSVNVEEVDASKFVLEDLQSRYPSADISIMTITTMYNAQGGKYFEVKAKVTQDAQTPCPKRSHIFYNYPDQNFVPQTPEIITSNCQVCASGPCTIAFEEEAIIASHTMSGTSAVHAYVTTNKDAVPDVKKSGNIWKVTWDSNGSASYYIVDLYRNGTIKDVSVIDKV